MGFDQYHEPPDELPAETRTFARLCASLTEEAEAIGWYEQRLAVEPDSEARAIMRDAQGEDSVSRLLRMTAGGLSGLDTEQVVSNICGLLVGAIETTSQAIVNATEQILLREGLAETRAADLRAGDELLNAFAFPAGYEYLTDAGEARVSNGTVKIKAIEPGGEADLYSLKIPRTGRFVFSSGVIGKADQ